MPFSFALPPIISIVGLFLLFKLRFFLFRHPLRLMGEIGKGLMDKGARRSFLLALAGTLGVGNIFGVAAGIMIGGAGVVFWIFVSSIFSAIIKYAEVVLVFKQSGEDGMAGVIGRCLPLGRWFSPLYAGLTVLLSLFMGASLQASALMDVAESCAGINPFVTTVLLAALLAPAFAGGVYKIEKITEKLIPMTTIIYILMCFAVIFLNFDRLLDTFASIFCAALSPRALLGGGGVIAIKEGFARGIMSNEAGSGTSALAHARSMDRSPHRAGLFGVCEVLFDTTLLCTLTGITILVSCPDLSAHSTPMALVFASFNSTLGHISQLALPIIFCFAYSTMICCFYYGAVYCERFFGGHKSLYLITFLAFVLVTPALPTLPLIYLTDFVLLLMTLLTLCAIIKESNKIKKELPL